MKSLVNKTLLVLAIGALFSSAASAREVRKGGRGARQFRTEKKVVRCDKCKRALSRREAIRFAEAKRMVRFEEMRKAAFRGPAFEKSMFHKHVFDKRRGHKRHMYR